MSVGTSGDDILIGSSRNDVLQGLEGNDELSGLDGSDWLYGGIGADRMWGGAGHDRYYVDDIGDRTFETDAAGGTDTVYSTISLTLGNHIENLVLEGTAALTGRGNALANRITGNDGDNLLDGRAGADRMFGGLGDDRYIIDNVGDRAHETDPAGGTDTVNSSVSYWLGPNLENLVLTGAAGITGRGNDLANVITGNAAGNLLDGRGGADTMRGGAGDDRYYVDDSADLVIEIDAAHGTDYVYSWASFTLGRHVETLNLQGSAAIDGTGNELDNILSGNSGANVLDGGAGADKMFGGLGDDRYIVDDAGDRAAEHSAAGGIDTVESSVTFTLARYIENLDLTGSAAINGSGNAEANRITGNAGANILSGWAGDDVLLGGAGGDTLRGHDGNDTLDGGAGSDTLTGGIGSDRFVFAAALGGGNLGRITDFSAGEDRIILSGGAGDPFAALASGALAAGAFRTGTVASDADDRIIYNSGTGALLYDADGQGGAAAIQFATLNAGLTLSAADFQVTGPANHSPTISSGTTASVAENSPTSTIVYQGVANDADGDSIVWSLSGADAAFFTIDQSGALRFRQSPDYETRTSYSVTVRAADSSGAGANRNVTVSVTDVVESLPAYNVVETSGANDTHGQAQPLDRTLFTPVNDNNVPDKTLPTARIDGVVTANGDKDFYRVYLEAGEMLIIDVDGTDTLDAWVDVYDASGSLLTFSDDQVSFDPGSTAHTGVSHNMDSLVMVRAPTAGFYTFSVRSWADDQGVASSAGEYRLNVSIGPVATRAQIDEENIQAVMSGATWGTLNLTFGFTTSGTQYGPGDGIDEKSTHEPMNPEQQAAVRTILGQVSGLTNLTFQEAFASPGTADLRFAQSGFPETAHAYYPGAGDGGDSWYNSSGYLTPKVGNYQWLTFVHETGHALGLKHGHESPAISPDRDSMEYSVMTYRSHIGTDLDGGGFTNETWGFAQTLMMYDIAALQRMYGADFTHNGGNSVYSWNPSTGAFLINGVVQWTPGANRVFMTIWDGNGIDTYNLSNYSNAVTIDLRPGEWTTTSAVQIANLGEGYSARGNVANALLYNGDVRSLIENATGGSGNDTLIANQAANRLTGGGGLDHFTWFSTADASAAQLDTVVDFVRGHDRIDLKNIDAVAATDTEDSFTYIGNSAFSGTAGELRWSAEADGVHIFGDVNGDGVADFEILVANQTMLSTTDFIF